MSVVQPLWVPLLTQARLVDRLRLWLLPLLQAGLSGHSVPLHQSGCLQDLLLLPLPSSQSQLEDPETLAACPVYAPSEL